MGPSRTSLRCAGDRSDQRHGLDLEVVVAVQARHERDAQDAVDGVGAWLLRRDADLEHQSVILDHAANRWILEVYRAILGRQGAYAVAIGIRDLVAIFEGDPRHQRRLLA